MEYQRLTRLSDMGTLHALDFDGEEQPLCELTALDIDVLIGRLYELENKIESGELGDVKELKQELKAQELAANAYRIFFAEQKYWREVAERALLNACEDRIFSGYYCCAYRGLCDNEHNFELDEDCAESARFCRTQYLKQAEKELAQEKKDEY